MKKSILLALSVFVFTACGTPLDEAMESQIDLGFQEIYIHYDPETREGELILYGLQASRVLEEVEIQELSESLLDLSEETLLSKDYFGITTFTALEEGFYDDGREMVKLKIEFEGKGETTAVIQEIFSNILHLNNTTYADSAEPNIIMTTFFSEKDIHFSDYDEESIQTYYNDSDPGNPQYAISWNTDKPYEIVIGNVFDDDLFESLYPYFLEMFTTAPIEE